MLRFPVQVVLVEVPCLDPTDSVQILRTIHAKDIREHIPNAKLVTFGKMNGLAKTLRTSLTTQKVEEPSVKKV